MARVSKLTLAVIVTGCILLIVAGVCPLTIQLLMLGALALALVRRGEEQQKQQLDEHFEPAKAEVAVEQLKADRVVYDLPKLGSLLGLEEFPDVAGTWRGTQSNPKQDVIVLRGTLSGPPSKDSGVFEDFTLQLTAKIPPAAAFSVLKVFGTQGGAMSSIELSLQPGAAGHRQLTLSVGGAKVSTDVNAAKGGVAIIARRSGSVVTLLQASGVDIERTDTALPPDTPRVLPEVTAPAKIAADGVMGGDVEITRLTVWSCALTDGDVQALVQKSWEAQLAHEPFVEGLVSERDAALQRAKDVKEQNPYGSDAVQRSCTAVTDWTLPDAVAGADAACWAAISAQCEAHPDGPGCGCWDPVKSTSASCQAFRAQLSGSGPVRLNALTPEQLESVKSTYKLITPPIGIAPPLVAMPVARKHHKRHKAKKEKHWWHFFVGE